MGLYMYHPKYPMHVPPKGIMIFKWIIVFHTHNSSQNQLQNKIFN